MDKSDYKVCVTGGAGYIGSSLVNKLLQKGYTVHATLRSLDDPTKVGLLKSFTNAETRLLLFEADIYYPDQFARAIAGCQFVFHVATPKQHNSDSQPYKNTTEAAIAGAKSIAMSCIRSGTVRRLIYTATVIAASALKDDGSCFKKSMDETCWTPLNLSCAYSNDYLMDYRDSKTLAEREILAYGSNSFDEFEVVTLACGLVGGDALLSYTPASMAVIISMLTNNATHYQSLKYIEELLGKIPIVHIDDVCEAHIFCLETPSIDGRFLCANSYVSSAEIADYYLRRYSEFSVKPEYLIESQSAEVLWGSPKLKDHGFNYKHDMRVLLDGCVQFARKMGDL